MRSLLLMSILLVTLGAPFYAARQRDPRRGVISMCVFYALFVVVYRLYVAFLHTRYFYPHR